MDTTRDGLMAANDHDSGHVQAQAVATDVGNAPALDQAQDLAVFMPTEAEQALIPAALHEVAPPSVPRTRKHGNMYSLEIRKLCVDKFDQGMKYKDIAMELGMPATSVQLIVKRAKQLGSVQVGQRTGRPRRTDGAVDDFIMELMRAEPSVTPLIVQSKLEEHKKVKISLQTVRRRMEECSAQQRQQYAVLPDMYGGASTTCKAAGNAMAELTTLSRFGIPAVDDE
ncbi:TPA: hypothetical protein N0F65_007138 [Lagenidium giganteum]|uniref:Uncharacterized protein n=1 Tax=Lagenidium giganteum TaxID=4803 RepID=A0AAV2YYI4_9STRA|nr:TPA: hypothetical protein N0F65_007138 [Lagenidium giganteum]